MIVIGTSGWGSWHHHCYPGILSWNAEGLLTRDQHLYWATTDWSWVSICLFHPTWSSHPLNSIPYGFSESESVGRLVMSDSFETPWTVARQAPQTMGFSSQEYWSGLPCPSPGDLPDPWIEPGSPALQADTLPSEPPGKPLRASNSIWPQTFRGSVRSCLDLVPSHRVWPAGRPSIPSWSPPRTQAALG